MNRLNAFSLQDNFQECKSEVEIDYITGMKLKKEEAKVFLAGKNFRSADNSEFIS